MDRWLLSAAHMKAVPGHKSDVRDAEWIAQLVEHGLVSPSLVPPPEIRTLRNLSRYRLQLMGDRTRDAGRLEKLLEDASIKLSVVASNITGTSSREMLGALVAGERDPVVMADFAHSTLRRKIPDPTAALTGHFDDHHAIIVGQLLNRSASTERATAAFDAELWFRMLPCARQLELLQTIPGTGLSPRKCSSPRPAVTISASETQNASRPGPGWHARSTSPPANDAPPGLGRATSG